MATQIASNLTVFQQHVQSNNKENIKAPYYWRFASGIHWWYSFLTHWGRVTYICVSKLTITGSDKGLSPGRRQVIIWTNAGILLIGPLGTIFNENLIGIQTFSFKKMHLKMSSAKWRPCCLGLNVLTGEWCWKHPHVMTSSCITIDMPEATMRLSVALVYYIVMPLIHVIDPKNKYYSQSTTTDNSHHCNEQLFKLSWLN